MEQSKVRELQDVVIRFSGDSGDGMQLTGTLFLYRNIALALLSRSLFVRSGNTLSCSATRCATDAPCTT